VPAFVLVHASDAAADRGARGEPYRHAGLLPALLLQVVVPRQPERPAAGDHVVVVGSSATSLGFQFGGFMDGLWLGSSSIVPDYLGRSTCSNAVVRAAGKLPLERR
jgi:hypothetical protein